MEFNEKQALQEAEYDIAFHWNLPGAEGLKYRCLSRLIANLAAASPEVSKDRRITFIDLGCGDGASTSQITTELRSKGIDVTTHGYDYSERAIVLAKEKTADMENPPNFSVQSVEDLPGIPDDAGAVVVLMREVIEHLTDEQIDDTVSKLKESCQRFHLILTTPSVNSPVEPKHYRHYDEEMMSDVILRNGLALDRLTGFSFRPKALLRVLSKLKTICTYRPRLAPLTRPLWVTCSPGMAQTLVAVGRHPKGE